MSDSNPFKNCNTCGESKPTTDFWSMKSQPDGRSLYCKACAKQKNADAYRRRLASEGRSARDYMPLKRATPPGQKWCPSCSTFLPLDDFVRNRSQPDGIGGYCRPCANRITRENKIKKHGSTREYHLRRRYGLTSADVVAIVEAQGGICVICGASDPQHVDHDHETGEVRGVICFNCNGGLGQFKDNPSLLLTASRYLMGAAWRREPASEKALRLVVGEYRHRVSTTS